jgi:hypothetical protein
VGKDTWVVSRNYDDLRNETLAKVKCKTFVAVFAEDHLLAVAKDDRAVGACLTVGNTCMGTVVEDHAVDKALDDASTLVLVSSYHTIDGGRHVYIQGASKEGAACSEYKFSRDEWTLYSTEWTRLADKTLR